MARCHWAVPLPGVARMCRNNSMWDSLGCPTRRLGKKITAALVMEKTKNCQWKC